MNIFGWIKRILSLAFKFLFLFFVIGFISSCFMLGNNLAFNRSRDYAGELSYQTSSCLVENKQESALIAAEKERFSRVQKAVFLTDMLPARHDFTVLRAPKGHSRLRLVVWGGDKPHVGGVTLTLNRQYSTFHLNLSPYDRMHDHHSLMFEIVGDGRMLSSIRVSPDMEPRVLNLNVCGLQSLTIRAYSSNYSTSVNPGVILDDAFFD